MVELAAKDVNLFTQAFRVIRLGSLVSGLLLGTTLHAADHSPLCALAISPNGQFIATGGKAGTLVICEGNTGKDVLDLTVGKTIFALAYSPNGQVLAAGCEDRHVHLFAVERSSLVASHTLECRGDVLSLAFSPTGNLLAAGVEGSGNVHLFDVHNAKLISTLWEPANLISSLTFAPDGKTLASAGADFRVWDVRPEVLAKTASNRLDLDISDLRANEKVATKWVRGDGSEYAAGVAISTDGKLLAGVSGIGGPNTGGKTLRIWDAASGQRLKTISSQGMTSVVFAREGQCVITGSDKGIVSVWDIQTGDLKRQWAAHSKAIRGVALVPGSNHLATISEDGTLKTWDWTTGKSRLAK